MKLYWACILFFLFFCSSCIEEYQIKGSTATAEKQLVVQGRIAVGDRSVVYVSYSQPLGDSKTPEQVQNAQVRIIGKNDYRSALAEFDEENGYYWIDTKELSDDTMYALQVEVDGESYQSEYLSLLETPEIKDVSYTESDEGVSIHIKTEGGEDSSPYYMWSYEEDWESHASVDITRVPGILCDYNKQIYLQKITEEYNPYYYCWGHNNSSQILIYNTKALQKNEVDLELLRIPVDDVRISYIYSILVKQYSLSDEAYRYYRSMEEYIEESSGLFPPMPNEIKGNMTCTSNPDISVRGYVLAANVQSKRIFIYASDFKQIYPGYEEELGCKSEKPDLSDVNWKDKWNGYVDAGALVVSSSGKWQPLLNGSNPDYVNSVLYHRACVDCRFSEGSTKKRPDFWPTNHE